MADVGSGDSGGGHGRHQKKRAKKLPTRIDMTPMVDLGFLLLTFFMLATTFSKPKVIELTPPAKTKDTTVFKKVNDTLALTIILSANNRVYWYKGQLNNGQKILTPDSNNMQLTNFGDDGIRKIVLQRNAHVLSQLKPLDEQRDKTKMADTTYERLKQFIQGDPKALFVIIKTDSVAKYVNVITMLDEMNICSVDKYALVDVSQSEILMMRDYNNKNNIK
jgi:biopolymer transport protein ExbD